MQTPKTAGGLQDLVTRSPAREDNSFSLVEMFHQRPALNADVLITSAAPTRAQMALILAANLNFEVAGTNMTTALCTFADGGGIVITTAGASADSGILQAHLDTNQTEWAVAKFNTNDEVGLDVEIKTGAAITSTIIWAGMKVTNTDVVATDDHQVYFRYEAGVNSGQFQCIYSIAGVDYTINTSIVVAASTAYRLQMRINADRVPRFFINGLPVGEGTALTADIDLKLFVGVKASTGSARAITVRPHLRLSKIAND